MKFTRGADPHLGIPCWELRTRLGVLHADWTVRRRIVIGASLSVNGGESLPEGGFHRWSACLDLNAPLDEPNRFYLHVRGWWLILGLPSTRWWVWPEEEEEEEAGWVRKLHIDGCDRYRYHQEKEGEGGEWIRNEKPEKWHWGWLTVSRMEKNC